MRISFDTNSMADYQKFLAVKRIPKYRFVGSFAEIPDEYAHLIGSAVVETRTADYVPIAGMFDYQRDIAAMAIKKRKYAVFADCGLGKTLILLEFARHAADVLPPGRCVLIVSPLMVVTQTIAEAQRFYGDTLPIEFVPARNLTAWLKSGTSRIGITNYDALTDDTPQGRIEALILDECFAADTLVDVIQNGVSTQKRIDNILSGDRILNASGVDRVVRVKRREVPYAVVVNVGTKITCSPNHPVFTQRGWVCAQDLEPGDSILSSAKAMRMVRGELSAERHAGVGEVLRQILLSEMENESAGIQGQVPHAGGEGQEGRQKARMAGVRYACREKRIGSDQDTKSHEQSTCATEGVEDSEGHEPQTFRAWWQRTWFDASAEDSFACSRIDLASGVSFVVGPAKGGLSNALQARLGESRNASVYRGGWSITSLPEGCRREAYCHAGFARVEGIEVLEQGHPELERLRASDGKLYFYDLEAERHPSFSVAGLLVHNSSMLKSHYGKWGTKCIELGQGVEWKLACTGTPAPNDRIEYANHAVFLDAFPNVNAFLARFFVNRGQTQERWALKPHALRPFYHALSHWCIFLTNPATYGWRDNCENIPPIHVHVHSVPLTPEQRGHVHTQTGALFTDRVGGITSRIVLSRLAKGSHNGQSVPTNKPEYIRKLVDSWPDESTIIWCLYNDEQASMERTFPEAASISGDTPYEKRMELIDAFKSGRCRVIISKPKVLGFGLNLQIATRQVFSGLQDSYESYYQAVKRSNRYGSTRPLNVHIPVTEIERPMIETVLAKAKRVQHDTEEQEALFKHASSI